MKSEVINKIAVLNLAKNEWYALHSKIMKKKELNKLDTLRVKRCKLEIILIDKRIDEVKNEYRLNRFK